MKPINEIHFMNHHQLPFVFRPLTVTDTKKIHPYTNWHRNIEILYCVQGSGKVMIDDKCYTFSEGDSLIINSNQMHTVLGPDNGKMVHTCLIIDRNFCFDNGVDTDRLRFIIKIRDKQLNKLIDELLTLYTEERFCVITKIRKIILDILILLCSAYIDKDIDTSSFTDSGIERTNSVLNYIREHYTERITLENMARTVGISKFYLCREFKKITGVSVTEYINKIRCQRAKELLETGATVSEASEKCGFESLHYFTKTFKRYVGEKPSEFKIKRN